MVIEDFSPSLKPARQVNQRIAPVMDRVLALVFDVILFTPVFGFALAKIFQQLHRVYFLSPESSEFSVLVAITVVCAVMLALLVQTLCLLLWQATPGKFFFKLKVIAVHYPERHLNLTQALLRSALWCVEVFFLMLPWLEVLSQRERRPLHDRAAETMVITQKRNGDQGPHWLETQFIRQFLLASFLVFFLWTLFSVSHYYRMAVQGDFRRAELDARDLLCSDVASNLQRGELRIDKALALYLAGEVSEDCLSAEADFVMWAPESEDKPWAYLAEAFLVSYDPESQKEYFGKVCETGVGEACEIARYKLREKSLEGESLTAQILRSELNFENGNYVEAEKLFTQLGEVPGFESYAQESFVKIFWSQNQTQKAEGAYATIVHEMDFQHKQALAAWMCHEEIDKDCSSDRREACEDLKEDYIADENLPIHDSYVALALLRERACRPSEQISGIRFHDLLEQRKDVLDFSRAISPDTVLSATDRRHLLTQLAFRKESVRPAVIRTMAMQALIEKSLEEKELTPVVSFLKNRKVKDFLWVKIFRKTLLKLNAMSATPMVAELVALPSPSLVATYHLEGMLTQGRALIAKTHFSPATQDRLPASAEKQ